MTKMLNFLKLNNSEKIILVKALLFLWIVRIMLSTLPFNFIHGIMKKFTKIQKNNKSQFSKEKLIWTINVMSTFTPNASCLTRALSAQILLANYNYPSNIKIGVSKNEGEFEAHAWLESDEKIILGKSHIEYVPILKMGENTE